MEEITARPEEIIEDQPKVGFLDKLKIYKFKILGGVLGILVLVGAVFGAYKLGQKQIQPQPSPTPEAVVSPSPDPAADWKIYTNTKYGYSIKFPSDWGQGIEIASFVKEGYSLTIGPAPIELSRPPNITITTSKVKVGDRDYLKETWKSPDGRVDFERINLEELETEENKFEIILMYKNNIYNEEYALIFNLMLSTFKFLEVSETQNWKTYTNESQGISFNYPPNWTVRTDSQYFENGDLFSIYIVGPTQKKDTEFYDGVSFTVAIPLSTSSTLEEWLDLEGWTKPSEVTGELPKVTKGLKLGNGEAVQVYICGLGCFTYRFAKHEGKIYGIVYFAEGDQKSEYEKDISRIISTLRFLD